MICLDFYIKILKWYQKNLSIPISEAEKANRDSNRRSEYFIVRSPPSAISTHARDFFPSFLLRFSILRIQLPIQYVVEREAEISRGRKVEVRNCNGPLSPEAKIKLRKRRCRRKTIWASRVRLSFDGKRYLRKEYFISFDWNLNGNAQEVFFNLALSRIPIQLLQSSNLLNFETFLKHFYNFLNDN